MLRESWNSQTETKEAAHDGSCETQRQSSLELKKTFNKLTRAWQKNVADETKPGKTNWQDWNRAFH